MQVISFYNSNINPELVEYQRRVFERFDIPLMQIVTNLEHGLAIDVFLNEAPKDGVVVIFDIDCIPLHKHVVTDAIKIVDHGVIYGAAQKANHIEGSEVYCSPAFCCFSLEHYRRAGKPTFKATQWHDVGGFFTNEMIRVGSTARLLWPVDVENPVWDLTENIKFGHGTNYQNTVYHAFESRFNHESTSRFIKKCKEILGEHD